MALSFDTRKEKQLAIEYLTKLNIKAPSIEQLVANFQAATRQKVVVSKVLATDAEIMIFDEPTRGIDVGGEAGDVQPHPTAGERRLKSVILVSSEMEEVIGLSDRIAVLLRRQADGQSLKRGEFDQERILSLASGLAL